MTDTPTRWRKKPVTITARTFEQFVAIGAEKEPANAAAHGGYAWHFEYEGHPVTHENDDCYLIPTLEGSMRFERGSKIITGIAGEIYPCKPDIFEATYEAADEPGSSDDVIDPLAAMVDPYQPTAEQLDQQHRHTALHLAAAPSPMFGDTKFVIERAEAFRAFLAADDKKVLI